VHGLWWRGPVRRTVPHSQVRGWEARRIARNDSASRRCELTPQSGVTCSCSPPWRGLYRDAASASSWAAAEWGRSRTVRARPGRDSGRLPCSRWCCSGIGSCHWNRWPSFERTCPLADPLLALLVARAVAVAGLNHRVRTAEAAAAAGHEAEAAAGATADAGAAGTRAHPVTVQTLVEGATGPVAPGPPRPLGDDLG
jgi:hypothetical protein